MSESLDLFSTSQTRYSDDLCFDFFSPPKYQHQGCIYHAPFFAIEKNPSSGVWSLSQGQCHHWDCPRCGIIRAKHEYWRIVKGSQQVVSEGHSLYFLTITTRGVGLPVAEAEKNYLQWTNRLLTNLRGQSKRRLAYWCYVQVTERQNRKHPHSHILTTYEPLDLVEGAKWQYEQVNGVKQGYWQDALRSHSLQCSIGASGLGEVYDISLVKSAAAVSRYIGKYLFKQTLLTVWPEGWRRVRYSQNWPQSDFEPASNAIALINKNDWFELAKVAETVITHDQEAQEIASNYLWAYPVEVKLKQGESQHKVDKTSTKS